MQEEPTLPLKELNDLKTLLFSLLPQYWINLVEFEVKCSLYQLGNCVRIRGKSNETLHAFYHTLH